MTRLVYPTTNLKAIEQLIIERGQGVYVWDKNGKQYLEGMAGLWCTALGYGNEELAQTAADQMRKLPFSHLFGGKSHPLAMALAERIAAMVPVKDAHVFFGNSGSDANDTHWKILRYFHTVTGQPQKRKIIVRDRAYHGVTVATAAMTGLNSNHAHFDLPFEALGIVRTDATHFYRQGLPGETEENFATRLAENLEKTIVREGPETIAAFAAEPISGAGGVVLPPKTYWEKVQAVLGRYGILLLDDEVITGFGRTGKDFGATTYGIKPDLMTVAKALSSAYVPISAAIVRGDIYEALVEPSAKIGMFGHGYTYSGHPVACAVALQTLEIYARDRIFEKAAPVGVYLQKQLRSLAGHPLVGEIRGIGLIAAVEMVPDRKARTAFEGGRVGLYAQQAALEHGLVLRAVAGSSLAICPPLIITEAQVDELVDKLRRTLDDTLAFTHAR